MSKYRSNAFNLYRTRIENKTMIERMIFRDNEIAHKNVEENKSKKQKQTKRTTFIYIKRTYTFSTANKMKTTNAINTYEYILYISISHIVK